MPTVFSSPRLHRPGFTLNVICLVLSFLLLSFLAPHAQAAPQPVGISVDSSSQTWLLWNNPDSSVALTKINPDGSVAATQAYAAISGWGCTAVAAGTSTPHLLWQRASDGQASVWTLDANGANAVSTPGYGTSSGYTVQGLCVDGDSQSRLLLKQGANNLFSVWTLAGSSYSSSTPAYGPYANGSLTWDARALAGGSDSLTRLLLVRSDGAAAVWTLNSSGFQSSSSGFSDPSGYSCLGMGVGGDNLTRLGWLNASGGGVGVWTLSSSGSVSSSTPLLGPPAGYTAVGMAVGLDNLVRLLWRDGQGDAQIWTVAANGTYTSATYSNTPTLAAAATGASKVTLFWNGSGGASGYNVYRSTTSGGPYTQVATNVSTADTGPGLTNAFMYSDTGLTTGTEYFYVVSPVYSGTAGPQSNEATAVPQAGAVPWDSGNPTQIINSINGWVTTDMQGDDDGEGDTIPQQVGTLAVAAPDGVVYLGNLPDGSSSTAYPPSAHYNNGTIVYNNGVLVASPDYNVTNVDTNSATPALTTSKPLVDISDTYPYARTTPPSGIFRQVQTQPGYWGEVGTVGLPNPSDSTVVQLMNYASTSQPGAVDYGRHYSDAGDIYFGGHAYFPTGTVFPSGTPKDFQLDAGLQLTEYPCPNQYWEPVINPHHQSSTVVSTSVVPYLGKVGWKTYMSGELRMQFLTPLFNSVPTNTVVLHFSVPVVGLGTGKILLAPYTTTTAGGCPVTTTNYSVNYLTIVYSGVVGWCKSAQSNPENGTNQFILKRINSIAQTCYDPKYHPGAPVANGPPQQTSKGFLMNGSFISGSYPNGAYWGDDGDAFGVELSPGGGWTSWTSDSSMTLRAGAYPVNLPYVTWLPQNRYSWEDNIDLSTQ